MKVLKFIWDMFLILLEAILSYAVIFGILAILLIINDWAKNWFVTIIIGFICWIFFGTRRC